MVIPWAPPAKYASLALTAGCSGVGACFLTTHKHSSLPKERAENLGEELKQSIHGQMTTCIGKEKARLEQLRKEKYWSDFWYQEVDKFKYDDCLTDISLGDTPQRLFFGN